MSTEPPTTILSGGLTLAAEVQNALRRYDPARQDADWHTICDFFLSDHLLHYFQHRARQILGHEQDAEDATIELAEKIYALLSSGKLHEIDEPIAYLHAILANIARGYLRKRRHTEQHEQPTWMADDGTLYPDIENIPGREPPAERLFEDREMLDNLWELVLLLPSPFRDVLIMRIGNEPPVPYSEIAARFGTSEDNARKILERARRKLRELYTAFIINASPERSEYDG